MEIELLSDPLEVTFRSVQSPLDNAGGCVLHCPQSLDEGHFPMLSGTLNLFCYLTF